MADPMLQPPQLDSVKSRSPRHNDILISSLDEIIDQSIGGFGWMQFVQVILVSLASLFDAQQTFISVYTDATPIWRCTNDPICNSSSNICTLPKSSWSWEGIPSETIISEWDLQCESSIITGLPSSSFFMGCLLGGFLLATLADSSLGRKKLLFLSCLTMSTTAILIVFSNNIWIYSALRFVSGFGSASIGSCVLVLSTEKVGRQWRGCVGITGFFFFTLGYLSLPGIAYINAGSSWRILYLWTSIPAIFHSILVQFFVSESPRWLLIQGQEEEAMKILTRIGTVDNESLSLCLLSMPIRSETSKVNLFSSIKDLIEKRWALQRLLALMAHGFGIGMVYYGMSLGVGNLGFNIYLSVMFNALLEIPSFFVTFFLIERWNRKSSLLVFCVISGICCIMCSLASNGQKGVQIGLELASLFSASTAYNVLLLYTTEMFPTCVRNTVSSMVRQVLIFGAVFSPLLVSAGRNNEFVSYGVFGFGIITCGFFVACLPETRGVSLCNSMEEQEQMESIIVC